MRKFNNESKYELFNAQKSLNAYLKTFNKQELEKYFASLRNVMSNLEKVAKFDQKVKGEKKYDDFPKVELAQIESLIDSVYLIKPRIVHRKKNAIQIDPIHFEEPSIEYHLEQTIIKDSIKKKKLLSRIKDAIDGKITTKKDTVFVVSQYKSAIDTTRLRENLDSSIKKVNDNYLREIKKVQSSFNSPQYNGEMVVDIYTNLIDLSNKLLDVYDLSSDDLSLKLEQELDKQTSNVNSIRRLTVLGLMILMFVVLVILSYFTRLSFVYERELHNANDLIQKNLNFKNRLLGMLSHEVRSPLKILKIFINRIDRKNKDQEITASLNSIRFTTDSLLIQAEQILEYTNDNSQKLQSIPFNLNQEIKSILEIFEPFINAANNQLIIENELPCNLEVESDRPKLHQLFMNLLGNANKFTQNGTISIDLKLTESSKYRVILEVSIKDTGIGISENDLKKVFEPYYKGIISENIENLGAGLGLNLCKEIVEKFQGNISLSSKLGEGTTVNFYIILGKKVNGE